MSVRFEMRVADALMRRIDTARGTMARAEWIKGVIERRLDAPAPATIAQLNLALMEAESKGAAQCAFIIAGAIKRAEA